MNLYASIGHVLVYVQTKSVLLDELVMQNTALTCGIIYAIISANNIFFECVPLPVMHDKCINDLAAAQKCLHEGELKKAAVWDGTFNTDVTDTNFNMEFKSDSDYKFFGFVWAAHDIRVFGPGSYTFDTSCSTKQLQAGIAVCGGGPFLTLDVGPGQIGAHVLFDWNTTDNIDVALQWDQNDVFFNEDPSGALYLGLAGPTPPVDCEYELVSRDGDGDGVAGYKMVDGPFIDFRANFNLNLTRNCGEGAELVAPKSTIKSSDPGGCTLSSTSTNPLSRSDLWLLLGLVGVLGAYTTCRRRLDSGMQH